VEPHAPFIEVYVATPIDECSRRDPKGMYALAFSGELENFTGVSDPYEQPGDSDVIVDTIGATPAESAAVVIAWLEERNLVPAGVLA